jgi:hypothetical protein
MNRQVIVERYLEVQTWTFEPVAGFVALLVSR